MSLEDDLRTAARGCTGITLWPCAEGWQAGRRNPDGGWSIGIDIDPVAALRKALRLEPEPAPDTSLFE